jgi:hypothetical protein
MWRRHHNSQLHNAYSCSDLPVPSERGGGTGTVWAAGRCQEARRRGPTAGQCQRSGSAMRDRGDEPSRAVPAAAAIRPSP